MQTLLYISIFIVAIAVTGLMAFSGLALFMWNRFLKAQLKSQTDWQNKMANEFQHAQEHTYYNVAGDGESVDLMIQDPANNQLFSFGESYPNPYWQNPGFAFAQNPMGYQHPEMQMGDASNMHQHYNYSGNIEQEVKIYTAIADRIRQFGTMPSQYSPDLN